jgi:tellurite methyltransferase
MSTPHQVKFIQQLKEQYDSWYRTQRTVFGDGEPLPLVTRIPDYLTAGRVLDVGGGDGRNALYLARQGWAVTVVDLSPVGLQKIKTQAASEGLHLDLIAGNILDVSLQRKYDAVVCSFVLHHLPETDAQVTLQRLQSLTTTNGLHVIAAMANHGQLYERAKKSGRFYPSVQQLTDRYVGWTPLYLCQKVTTTFAKHKDGTPMKNDWLGAIFQHTHSDGFSEPVPK